MLIIAGCARPVPSHPDDAASLVTGPPPARTATAVPGSPSVGPTATDSPASGLAIAAAPSTGEASLALVTATGALEAIEAPGPGVRQLRSFAGGGLLAVTGDGRLRLGSVQGAAVRWRVVPGVSGLVAASGSPDGTRIAVLARDRLGRGVPLVIGVVDVGGDRRSEIRARSLEANGGPTWLADGRIAVRALAAGERDVLALLRPGGAATDTIPLQGIDVVSSRDGSLTAILGVDSIRVLPSALIASPRTGSPVETPTGSGTERGQLVSAALDATGSRIAYVWGDESGTPRTIRVCAAADGWREVARVDVSAGTSRVAVAWTN